MARDGSPDSQPRVPGLSAPGVASAAMAECPSSLGWESWESSAQSTARLGGGRLRHCSDRHRWRVWVQEWMLSNLAGVQGELMSCGSLGVVRCGGVREKGCCSGEQTRQSVGTINFRGSEFTARGSGISSLSLEAVAPS